VSTREARLEQAAREIIQYEPPYKLDELPEAQELREPLPWANLAPKPIALKGRRPTSPLPNADVVVITWTVAEGFALGDVLTPGYRDVRPRKKPPRNTSAWYIYRPANFVTSYKPQMRRGAPALQANRLGTYCLTSIKTDKARRALRVLCFKSELHFNRDWIRGGPKRVPVADLFLQIIDEVRPKLIITAGTAGATLKQTLLGDVMMTRSAKLRLSRAFQRAPYNNKQYRCAALGPLQSKYLAAAQKLLAVYQPYLDPKLAPRIPKIWQDGAQGSYRKFLPILTTDRFEYGTSRGRNANYLGDKGCGVEMGDAFLGMVIDYLEHPTRTKPWQVAIPEPQALARVPAWLVIRNASDPLIDGNLSVDKQIQEAVFLYKKYGYFTSINGAIAAWAVIRGASL
jgi:hypothetical protein